MKKQNKEINTVFNYIVQKVGLDEAGRLLAILADSLDNLTDSGRDADIRTIEIVYNNFYSTKFSYETGQYEK